MATNQTEHYKLNQWELNDSVVMAEFNADNQKLDTALTALDQKIAEAVEQVRAAIPRIQIGSYVGTGTYGEENPTALTFDFEPKLIIITQKSLTSCCSGPIICLYGAPSMVVVNNPQGQHEFHPDILYMSWDGPKFSCYAANAGTQYNSPNHTYHYLAIG